MVMGAVYVSPPSFEVVTTCRLGYFGESAFSVQNTSTVPSEATVIWPVSRKPCGVLLLAALSCRGLLHVMPSSSEWTTKIFTLPLPAQLLQNCAQLKWRRPKWGLPAILSTAIQGWSTNLPLLAGAATTGSAQVSPSSCVRETVPSSPPDSGNGSAREP